MDTAWFGETIKEVGQYVVGSRLLGKGSFSDVRAGYDCNTGASVAVKLIKKKGLQKAELMQDISREEQILKQLSHPNIIKFNDVFDTDDSFVEVMELAPWGNLLHHVINKGRLSEQQARHIFVQLVSAVACLHSKNIVHRDIKMDNILLMDSMNTIKLIDFAFADYANGPLTRWCGTPFYSAPELVIRQPYGKKVDIWAMGVVLYTMLHAQFPFVADGPAALFAKIKQGEFSFNPEAKLSPQAKDLITGMLSSNPALRMDINQVLQHPWLINEEARMAPAAENPAERFHQSLL
jgi:serine/threonine protein kinase